MREFFHFIKNCKTLKTNETFLKYFNVEAVGSSRKIESEYFASSINKCPQLSIFIIKKITCIDKI